jgi:hypothetical protein
MKTNVEKVETALLSAKRPTGEFTPGPQWQNDVMREIRSLGADEALAAWLPLLDGLVWRVAPGLATLCILFFAYSMVVGGSPQSDVAQVLFFVPTEFLTTPALIL